MNILGIRLRFDQILWFRRRKLANDPVLAMLEAAPLTKEPVTEDDLESIRVGREEYRAGLTISSGEIKRAYREELQAAKR